MSQNAALLIYRELLRASKRTFKGDSLALNTVHEEIRNQFVLHKEVPVSEVDSKINDAREAIAFISENIVQARKKDCGTLEVRNEEDAKKLERMKREEAQAKKSSNSAK